MKLDRYKTMFQISKMLDITPQKTSRLVKSLKIEHITVGRYKLIDVGLLPRLRKGMSDIVRGRPRKNRVGIEATRQKRVAR